jgi:hypothetical protein
VKKSNKLSTFPLLSSEIFPQVPETAAAAGDRLGAQQNCISTINFTNKKIGALQLEQFGSF